MNRYIAVFGNLALAALSAAVAAFNAFPDTVSPKVAATAAGVAALNALLHAAPDALQHALATVQAAAPGVPIFDAVRQAQKKAVALFCVAVTAATLAACSGYGIPVSVVSEPSKPATAAPATPAAPVSPLAIGTNNGCWLRDALTAGSSILGKSGSATSGVLAQIAAELAPACPPAVPGQ